MGILLLFMAVLGGIVAWWLSQQRLMTKPWLEEGTLDHLSGTRASSLPTAKVGLGVFLAVVGTLFSLFITAYSMRMYLGEWRPLPAPRLLWFNTGLLVLSSIALQGAQVAANRGRMDSVRGGLLAGGAFAAAFLVGQLLAWRQLAEAGYLLAASPAVAFFYLLTAVHGLHLLGGLAALGRAADKVRRRVAVDEIGLSVELCAIYWHFLLLVWLLLFGLLLLTENYETLPGWLYAVCFGAFR
ncbi:MAG TPA: cytochrome c oxidase subunit 3 [Stellaceae bacterium]|jgi:cytochrome c oxidase subunit 3